MTADASRHEPLREPAPWRAALLATAASIAVVLLLFRDTALGMVTIWIRSETFQHAFLVVPIFAWLVWRRRHDVARQPVRPRPWLLVPIAGACLLWLLGELADVAAATHLALVSLVVLSVPALFGLAVAKVLAFPLLYLYFAAPIGEFAVPTLQDWTAEMTVLALRATGIPVYQEGTDFVIPTGSWSVIEACSGIRYLIACFMIGTLYAYLEFRSWRRRLLFVLAAIVVPIVANWIRAYSIVMVGHLTGSPKILGVDHTVYGWFLFGAIVALLFVVASRWTEAATEVAPATGGAPVVPTSGTTLRGWVTLAGIVALVVITHAWAGYLERDTGPARASVVLPDGRAGWRADTGRQALDWPHGIVNPESETFRSFVADDGRRVDAWVGYYRGQGGDRKLVTSAHRVASAEGRAWRTRLTGITPPAEGLPAFTTAVVTRGPSPRLATADEHRVWVVYWAGGRWLVRPWEIKLVQALDRLAGRDDDGAVLLLATPMSSGADRALDDFARAHLAAIDAALQTARAAR